MFDLVPDQASDIPHLPDANAEIIREAQEVFELNGNWTIPERAISVMRIKTGHFTVNVSINTIRPAKNLVVTFQGARGGGKDSVNSSRPMFARRNWEALFDAPILAISDLRPRSTGTRTCRAPGSTWAPSRMTWCPS